MARWTEHKAESGKAFYFDSESGKSVWKRPEGFSDAKPLGPISLRECLATDGRVRKLAAAVLGRCGFEALPSVRHARGDDALCADRRGGAYCCASNTIYLCADAPWVSCRELAYELSHAYNVCSGTTRCAPGGMTLEGRKCGYLSPPDLACSELRAAFWTGRCAGRTEGALRECLEWHAKWAVRACYPNDPHEEAHVAWASHKCMPTAADAALADDDSAERAARRATSSGGGGGGRGQGAAEEVHLV